MTNIV